MAKKFDVDFGDLTNAQINLLYSRIPSHFFQIPIIAMQTSTREQLAIFMDAPATLLCRAGYIPNYIGLAELLHFPQPNIENLRNLQMGGNVSPTVRILSSMMFPQQSLGELIFLLGVLERYDALCGIKNLVDRDIKEWQRRQHPVNNTVENNVSTPNSRILTNNRSDVDDQKLIIDDILKFPMTYDAFLVYAQPDINCGEDIATRCEREELKVIRGFQEILPPNSIQDAAARAMATRCRRLVVLLSKEFMADDKCIGQLHNTFSTDPASWNTKVIPVFLEDVKAPKVIEHLTGVKYYVKSELKEKLFWRPLIAALKAD